MDAHEFYDRIARRAHIGRGEAREAAHRVLRSIAACADAEVLRQLAMALPNHLAEGLAGVGAGADELVDSQVFIGRLVDAMDTEYLYDQTLGGMDLNSTYRDDDASLQVRAVFAALREQLPPEVAERVRACLPPEVRNWWDAAL